MCPQTPVTLPHKQRKKKKDCRLHATLHYVTAPSTVVYKDVRVVDLIFLLWLRWKVIVTSAQLKVTVGHSTLLSRPLKYFLYTHGVLSFLIHLTAAERCSFPLCWLSVVALTVNRHIHYMKQLKHRYCCCRPLVVTFVYHEFGTLCCATKLAKVPHFCTNYCSDWKCSPVISSGDICSLISWHLSFWGCKCQEWTTWHEHEVT